MLKKQRWVNFTVFVVLGVVFLTSSANAADWFKKKKTEPVKQAEAKVEEVKKEIQAEVPPPPPAPAPVVEPVVPAPATEEAAAPAEETPAPAEQEIPHVGSLFMNKENQ